MASRNVPSISPANADHLTGRGDDQQRYRIYRLCVCFECQGEGKLPSDTALKDWGPQSSRWKRCDECRGEGKTLDLVATCATPQDVGCALIQLAEEGEFEGCPIGILEDGGSWLVKPWLPSPRNVADAARVLARQKGRK